MKQIEKYKKELIYIKCKRGMLLMSLKAAFEADYALLGTIGQLIVMFGQKPWQISETLECSFKTDISQQMYSTHPV